MGSLCRWLERARGRRGIDAAAEERLTRTLELVVDAGQLQGIITGHLMEMYGAGRAALLMWSQETGRLQAVWQRGYGPGQEISFAGDGRLVRWLQVNEAILRPDEQPEIMQHLAEDERQRLRWLGAEVCLPLHAMNRLVALLILGSLRSRRPIPLRPQLQSQLGLALQNAALYAQQQLRLRRLSRTERLATAGELAASAAHEIRNPLTAISSAVQLLGEAFPAGSPRRDIADNVMREIDRINQIVEGLLSFARPTPPRREQVHLQEVIAESLRLVETMARKARVELHSESHVERDELEADRDQLLQVLVNLLLNAIQAMPEGGSATVRLGRRRRFRIEVSDNGSGMTPTEVERAFDPFYTTKERGTGLGLPICYGIVRRHGGDIDIESRPGAGTTVRVEL